MRPQLFRLNYHLKSPKKIKSSAGFDAIAQSIESLVSKKSNNFLKGKTSENKLVVFPQKENLIGTYVDVKVKECNSATLFGETGLIK